jgi:hypothetical protein
MIQLMAVVAISSHCLAWTALHHRQTRYSFIARVVGVLVAMALFIVFSVALAKMDPQIPSKTFGCYFRPGASNATLDSLDDEWEKFKSDFKADRRLSGNVNNAAEAIIPLSFLISFFTIRPLCHMFLFRKWHIIPYLGSPVLWWIFGFSVLILGPVGVFMWGVVELFKLRESVKFQPASNTTFYLTNDSQDKWGFGQSVPFFLLLTVVYAFLEEYDREQLEPSRKKEPRILNLL